MKLVEHHASGRSWRAACAVAAVWFVLAAGYLWLDAEAWIVFGLALFTLPALWDILSGRDASFLLTMDEIRWQSGAHAEAARLSDLAHVRLDRRWDATLRMTLVGRNGGRQVIPPDATPPRKTLQTALEGAGVVIQRHPFSIL